jgi:hypothetical protein
MGLMCLGFKQTPASSFSGSWMTAPQMAQEFAGLVQHRTFPVPAKTSKVNLFLPAQVFHSLYAAVFNHVNISTRVADIITWRASI